MAIEAVTLNKFSLAGEIKKKNGRAGASYCSAANCFTNKFDNPELIFFRFPNDEIR